MDCHRWSVFMIICTLWRTGIAIKVRLVQKPVPHAGRVEVLHDGAWGSICDDYWNIEDAHVICRQLGFASALAAPCCVPFGYNRTSRFWLDDVSCRGNETDIGQCEHNPWGVNDCQYTSQASVVCKPENFTANFNYRLYGGLVPYAGRVEVLHAGIWGDIDNSGWDINDAHVLCRSLGFRKAITVIYRSKNVFHLGYVIKWMKSVDCHGNETSLSRCRYVLEQERNSYGFDAGVVCDSENTTGLSFRLFNGTAPNAGRVEVQLARMWGAINFDQWDITSAHVICKQLGYAGAEMALHGATNVLRFQSIAHEWMRGVRCQGDEKSLAQCNYTIMFDNDISSDAGVVCSSNQSDVKFRLSGGGNSYGRIETFYGGVWGTVHNGGLGLNAATVLCRQLGFSGVAHVVKFAAGPFGRGSGPIWLTDLRCFGNESSLWDCQHSTVAGVTWSHDYDAGVACRSNGSQIDNLKVRLSGSSFGRVEVLYLGVWGTVIGLGKTAADVVCRQLGYPSSAAVFGYGAFGPGRGPVWLKGVRCRGNESSIGICNIEGFSSVYPTHLNDAAVICHRNGVTYTDFKVRLIGGYSYGRVEVQYKGVWGSVVHVKDNDLSRVGHVICRQLGFTALLDPVAYAAAKYGSGTGPVWMTHVRCLGNETTIGECFYDNDFHGRYPEFGVICNKTRLPNITTAIPSTQSPTESVLTKPTSSPSILSRFLKIGLPVIAGVVAFVILLVCFVKIWREKRGKYVTNNEFVRMDDVTPGAESIEFSHAFRNLAVEIEDEELAPNCERKWVEIPRSYVQLDEEIISDDSAIVFKGRLNTSGSLVRSCLVKSFQGPENSLADSTELNKVGRLEKHPNILSLIGACSFRGPLQLVFEFPECGSLLRYLHEHQTIVDSNDNEAVNTYCSLPKSERLRIALEVATAMKWLAQQNCVHGDLAARSVYLGKHGLVKIGNIGACVTTSEHRFRWMAPECLGSLKFTTQSDIWSYGILLWEIETGGSAPYSDIKADEINQKLKSGYKLSKPFDCPENLYAVIVSCTHYKPGHRPDFNKVYALVEAIISKETGC